MNLAEMTPTHHSEVATIAGGLLEQELLDRRKD
jgi:hypothetical protein